MVFRQKTSAIYRFFNESTITEQKCQSSRARAPVQDFYDKKNGCPGTINQ